MMRYITLCTVGLLGIGLGGCQPDLARVEITADTTPPLEHSISGEAIKLTHGTAVAVTVKAFNEDDEYEDGRMSFLVPNGGPMSALERIAEEEGYHYVLLGERPGTDQVTIYVEDTNGEVIVPLEVLPQ